MIVYSQEKSDGLAEPILASCSVAYNMQLEEADPNDVLKNAVANFDTKASKNDDDLLFLRSVLVSTVWNKNDDIFLKDEVWAARHTPSHKPTNINHDEKIIVGHMTEEWAIDEDGNIIDDAIAIDELPDLYHVIVGSVIYKQWQDQEYIERTQKLIAEIQNGTKFVSMECKLRGFDYGAIGEDGKQHIIARNQETAFLTKHLRCYGGAGEYDNYKLGRVLRNITFSAKGYVDNPANPDSVIFAHKDSNLSLFVPNCEFNNPIKNSGVSSNCQAKISNSETSMENELLQKQYDELKASNSKLQDKVEELTTQLAEVNVKKYEDTIAELKDKLEAADKEKKDAKKKKEDDDKEMKSKSDELKEALAKVDELSAELETIKVEARNAERVSQLVDSKVDRKEAKALVEEFADVSDEKFQKVAALAIKSVASNDDSDDDEDEGAEANTDTSSLENAEASSEAVPNADDDDGETTIAKTRAAIGDWFSSDVLNNNNGE